MRPVLKIHGKELQSNLNPDGKLIILAGATGQLGQHIAGYLLQWGARVRVLVREGSSRQAVAALREQGAEIAEVDFNDPAGLTRACRGGTCLVSALSGVREVIVDVQTKLLQAAVAAGVPRFIPSDYCIDFTKLPPGGNRNLDLRREFGERLDQAPVAVTSILNGMFTDLLTGQAPVILFGLKRVFYWGSADQLLDFTTLSDTAAFTAVASLEDSTPRYLRIAGEVASIKDLQTAATQVTGNQFRLFRGGGLGAFKLLIKVTKALTPSSDEAFPAWQGMQYLYDMFTGLPKLEPLDNHRYPGFRWTSVREVLAGRDNGKAEEA